ncbi:Agamous-like MADS-box protein [Sesamum angolense]|uniref:Agamous-like MADS-box protein n=1 Tax=Sesamum angolense TaxID=2727404 RepID=A0AAE1WVW8_9LAMI|nr:Agamous-like MADS-box protein [Sesamum angolense]
MNPRQLLKEETATLYKKIELLDDSKRKLLGENLDSCSTDELEDVEKQLERSLNNIRTRKNLLFKEQIDQLKGQEKKLTKENIELRKKSEVLQLQLSTLPIQLLPQPMDVETALFIGLPEPRTTNV